MKMEPDSINGENEHSCSAAKRPRRDRSVSRGSRGRHESGDSYSDSVSSLEEYELPSSTSYWDTHVLDDLGISYMEDYLSSPLDVLGMIYTETGLFGPLSDEQKELVKLLQNNIVYSHSVSDLFQRPRGMDTLLDMHREMVKNITDIENNQNISWSSYAVVDFIRHTTTIIKLQYSRYTEHENVQRGSPVSEDVFVDMFKSFVKMCRLLPLPGSQMQTRMTICNCQINSAPDIVVVKTLDDDLNMKPIVSVVQVKNMVYYRKDLPDKEKQSNTRPPGSPASRNSPVHEEEPAIFKKISGQVLGQFGGELLTHLGLYLGKLGNVHQPVKYLPGMIVIGTEVTFCVLKISEEHITELTELNVENSDFRSYIYYSKPKDLLNKDDRDILIESFVRLCNIST